MSRTQLLAAKPCYLGGMPLTLGALCVNGKPPALPGAGPPCLRGAEHPRGSQVVPRERTQPAARPRAAGRQRKAGAALTYVSPSSET